MGDPLTHQRPAYGYNHTERLSKNKDMTHHLDIPLQRIASCSTMQAVGLEMRGALDFLTGKGEET